MAGAMLAACLLVFGRPADAAEERRWATGWATAPMAMEGDNALPGNPADEVAIRQTARLSIGGEWLRVRVTNRHGTAPLRILSLRVARATAAGAATDAAGTDRIVRFAGETSVTVPAGAEYWSDSVDLPIAAGGQVGVTVRTALDGGVATGHPGARTTVRIARGGAAPTSIARWYFVSAIDVAGSSAATIAVLGDSITDGYGVKDDSDGRWTDYLSQRLQASAETRHLAVANLGIGGNRLLLDSLGPNALARFDRDVLSLSGVRHLIILIGVNDLGTLTRDGPATQAAHAALVARMLAGYRQIVARARAAGIRVAGATIMPFGASAYYHPDAATEADRQAINTWLRSPGAVDAVIDFDAALHDRARPDRLLAAFDADGLHPSDAGYRAMAAAVPMAAFVPSQPRIALTFDDLPLHGPLPKGMTADAVVRAITATLKRDHVVEAFGFVNGAKTGRDTALLRPLRLWRAAGYPLGNHGWSHANLDDIGAAAFATELTRNEDVLRATMGAADWRYFRYPFLAEGRDRATHDAARRVLADRGYRIAPVSLDFADWRFNAAYARCADRGDAAAVMQLENRFLAAAGESLAATRQAARARYDRDIPLVLLLHAGAFTAHMLPRLLSLLRAQGEAFDRLEAALADPAYEVSRNLALAGPSDPVAAEGSSTADVDGLCKPA